MALFRKMYPPQSVKRRFRTLCPRTKWLFLLDFTCKNIAKNAVFKKFFELKCALQPADCLLRSYK